MAKCDRPMKPRHRPRPQVQQETPIPRRITIADEVGPNDANRSTTGAAARVMAGSATADTAPAMTPDD